MVRQNRVDYIRSSSLNREIALSTVLHVLVVLSAFIVLPTPEKISLPDYALPIDVITIDDFTRLTSQDPKPETKTDQAEEIEKPPANIRQETAPPPPADNTDAMPLLGPKPASTPKPKEADSMPEPVNLVGNVVPLARPRPAKPERKPLLDTAAVQALSGDLKDQVEHAHARPNFQHFWRPQARTSRHGFAL